MITALVLLFALVACLALLDLAGLAFGADSRDGITDDHRR